MPAVSRRQQRFMGMASTPEGRRKLRAKGVELPPVSVAMEFRHLSKKVKASDYLKKST